MNQNKNIIIKLVPELRLFPFKKDIQYTKDKIDHSVIGWLFVEIIIDNDFQRF